MVENSRVEAAAEIEEPEESLFSDSSTVEMMGNEPTPPSSSSTSRFVQHCCIHMECREGDRDARRASC